MSVTSMAFKYTSKRKLGNFLAISPTTNRPAVCLATQNVRQERGKEDTTVYGISTDDITFNFYRISRSSKVNQKNSSLHIEITIISHLKVVFDYPDLRVHNEAGPGNSSPGSLDHGDWVKPISDTYP